MATIKPELRTILDRYGINPNDQSQVWDCRGTLVLYHKAYEIIAAKESISFDPPTVIRAEKTDAVILVTGRMGERSEWSFGEAVIDQNYMVKGKQAAYPWAMAEKRAKDRVIAKLVGLAAYVLSEDEADELKEGKGGAETGTRTAGNQNRTASRPFDTGPLEANGPEDWAQKFAARVAAAPSLDGLNAFVANNEPTLGRLKADLPEQAARLITAIASRRHDFSQAPMQAAE